MLEDAFFRTETENGVTVVVAAGEIDMATAPRLARALSEAGGPAPVLLDLCEVSFFDSSGVSVVLLAHQRLAGHGCPFAIACLPGGPVQRVFNVTGAAAMLALYASRRWALDALARSPRWSSSA